MRKRMVYSFAMFALIGIHSADATEKGASVPPVNFIQILTDDQGWGDLGSFGHQFIQTPHIDKLAAEGIKFTRCYSADSVCSPSRSAILTGRTPYRNGVYRWIPASHFCHLPASEITLPQLLRKNGYQTAHFGKWHLSDYSEQKDKEAGKAQYKDYGYGRNPDQPSMNDYGYDYWLATGNVARPTHKNPHNFFLNGKHMSTQEGFAAQLVVEQFSIWMQEHRKAGEPFFVTIWFHEPHGPVESDPRFTECYNKQKDLSLRQYPANVTQIDEAVGSMVQALDEAGVADDTLIFYTSDNGPEGGHEFGDFNQSDSPFNGSRYRGSSGGLRGRKRHTHEGGIRVPGIAWWPRGLKDASLQGTVCAEPIIGSDVFPTFLELAGVPLPEKVVFDSVSFAPLLTGGEMTRPRPLYWRNNYHKFQLALMDGDWKLVGNSKRTELELYNLRTDPRETSDLSAQHLERFEQMKSELIAYDRDVLAEGPDWWKKERAGSIPVD